MKQLFAVSLTAIALMGCSPKADHSEHNMSQTSKTVIDDETIEETGVVITNARVAPPFPGKDTAAGFFTIKNTGSDNRLVSVSSPISNAVEIHNHIEEDGMMKMRRVDGVDLAAGQSLEFKPGSYHIMMFKAAIPNDVAEVELTLNFENGSPAVMTVPIEGRDAQDGHSGH